MLELKVEWLDAPGVTSKVLAETWAQLTITATDIGGQTHVLSRLLSNAARSERTGIFGSVFPVAEWIVENWWFILHEPSRMPELPSGRMFSDNPPVMRHWAHRHNLLSARHGGALPDLSLYRDDEHIVVRSYADPDPGRNARPVRFLGEGELRLCQKDVEHGLDSFIRQVLSRLESQREPEIERLNAEWTALCNSRETEANLCAWAAAMGVDPYDSSELNDSLLGLIENQLPGLEPDLRTDLVEATSADTIALDLDWIAMGRKQFGQGATAANGFDWTDGTAERMGVKKTPYRWGYDSAQYLRKKLNLSIDPIDDFPKVLHDKCHWPLETPQVVTRASTTGTSGMIVQDSTGVPHVVWPGGRDESERFLMARSLFFIPYLKNSTSARLVTKAYTCEQAASRAFAAELLAPAEALRQKVSGGISEDDLKSIAARYRVSPMVVEYQLKNHHIGWVDES
ncbi:MAG TPA: ImmA/IrrE family metallo-endopeptidase [Planctomycetaceae bacterium]|jgi:hypothetical protein